MSTLYVVATPIGNLDDITMRALSVLKSVDVIAAETPSVARKLLSAYGISGKKVITVREANREVAIQRIRELLDESFNVALISDAGTPGISDPGAGIIDQLLAEGYEVVPVPGPSAITAMLSVFPLREPWVFLGFLPKRKGRRKRILEKFLDIGVSILFYETPYKIMETLSILEEVAPEVQMCLGREITKRYEEFLVGVPGDIRSVLADRKDIKGEIVCSLRVE